MSTVTDWIKWWYNIYIVYINIVSSCDQTNEIG